MVDRSLVRLAWTICGLTLLVLAASLVLILLDLSTPLPQGATPWRDRAVSLVGIVGAPIVGGLIASRRPRNSYGWLWLAFGLGLAVQELAGSYTAYVRVAGPETPVAPPAITGALSLGGPVALGLAPFLILLFPTGLLPSPRWRPLAWIAAASGTVIVILNLIFGAADRVGGWVTVAVSAAVFVTFGAIAVSALSLVVRYRRARGTERQQLKWFAFAAAISAFTLIAQQLLWGAMILRVHFLGVEIARTSQSLENLRDAFTNACLYTAVGIAILRYRLYDIDIIINRALVYGSLTVSLALVYLGGVAATQALFETLTGQQQFPQLAVVASTLAIAALFTPLRRRIQSFIDRSFYRSKYDARKTLEAFSAKLREETDLDELSGDLVGVVHETMRPEHVSLWLRQAEKMAKR